MSKRLLLADDSVTIQKVIGITFANEDYQLDVVDNGDSALDMARQQRPDMVLADVYMPGKNGYELCTAIKQDPTLANVPVLLLAGTFEPFDEDKALQAGADGWISKPFESQFLIDKVEELLAKAEAAPAAAVEVETAEEVDADAWGDEVDSVEEESLETAAEDDIWGAVSLDEDDLLEDLEEEPPAAEEPATAFAAEPEPAVADDDAWSAVDDEIFDLEDGDILDESDLLEAEEEEDVFAAPAVEAAPVDEDELLEDDSLEIEQPATGGWSVPGVELPDLDEPVEEPEAAELAPEAEVEELVEEPVVQSAAPVGAATVDEDQVAAIVERVATEVVERLAGTLLEKIAWEVVPDLAESIIKEEIRKIKASRA